MTLAADIDRRTLFRELNQRICDVDATFGMGDSTGYRLMCECGRDDCLERIDVPAGVFEAIRDGVHRFLVAAGHEGADGERVVESSGAYAIVSAAEEEAGLVRPGTRG